MKKGKAAKPRTHYRVFVTLVFCTESLTSLKQARFRAEEEANKHKGARILIQRFETKENIPWVTKIYHKIEEKWVAR